MDRPELLTKFMMVMAEGPHFPYDDLLKSSDPVSVDIKSWQTNLREVLNEIRSSDYNLKGFWKALSDPATFETIEKFGGLNDSTMEFLRRHVQEYKSKVKSQQEALDWIKEDYHPGCNMLMRT